MEDKPLVTATTINLAKVIICLVFLCLWYNGYRIFQSYIGYPYIYMYIMQETGGRVTKDLGIFDLYHKLGYTYSDVVIAFSRTISSFVGMMLAFSAMYLGQVVSRLVFIKRSRSSASSFT